MSQIFAVIYVKCALCRLIAVALRSTVKMSGGLDALALKEEDVMKLVASQAHLGSTNTDFQMEQYIFKRKPDGEHSVPP